MNNIDLIRRIAEHTRYWAQCNRTFIHVCDDDNDGFVNDKFEEDLCGMCAIASAELFRRLKDMGYSPKIALYDGDDHCHCFVLVNGQIVDVTATQFGKNPVEIVNTNEKNLPDFWNPNMVFNSVEELIANQVTNGWPQYQIAY